MIKPREQCWTVCPKNLVSPAPVSIHKAPRARPFGITWSAAGFPRRHLLAIFRPDFGPIPCKHHIFDWQNEGIANGKHLSVRSQAEKVIDKPDLIPHTLYSLPLKTPRIATNRLKCVQTGCLFAPGRVTMVSEALLKSSFSHENNK